MPKAKKREDDREQRIMMEIVVDAHDAEERSMGWHCYLEDELRFPFTATCIAKREISPLCLKDEVEVIGMCGENECGSEIFVTIRWEKDGLGVPLAQLRPIDASDEQTKQAVADWHYWVAMGYEF